MSETPGPIPTEADAQHLAKIYSVLCAARTNPFTTKSDLARKAANEVALAASEGFISTKLSEATFANVWMITAEGIAFMEWCDDVFSD